MQMSRDWIRSRAAAETLLRSATAALQAGLATRRVLLVTFESAGALDHAKALADIHAMKREELVHPHVEHGITREWEGAAIDAVVAARTRTYEAKQARSADAAGVPVKPAKPAKPPKSPK